MLLEERGMHALPKQIKHTVQQELQIQKNYFLELFISNKYSPGVGDQLETFMA